MMPLYLSKPLILIGVVVKKAEDVTAAVADGLANPDRESAIRKEMARHVFHAPGQAGRRVAEVVRYAAGLAPRLPDDVEVLAPDRAPVPMESA